MNLFLLKLAMHLHNFAYKAVSKLAILAEGGLHPKHRLMKYHEFFLDNISEGDTVLDIGCGNGALARDLAKVAKQVLGIDNNGKNQAEWTDKYGAPNLIFKVADATVFEPEEKFDAAVLSNVLEHIEQRDEFLKRIKHLAGKFLIRVPMLNRDWLTLYKKELGVEWRLDKTHFIEYTLESFTAELRQAGFEIRNYSIQFGEIWAVAAPV